MFCARSGAGLLLLIVIALGRVSPLSATIINGNFENPHLGSPSVSLAMPSWTEMEDGTQQSMPGPNSSVGIVKPLAPHPLGTDPAGTGNWGFIQLANQQATYGAFYQSIAVVDPAMTYKIFFDAANIDSVNLGIFNPVDARDPDTTVRVFFTLGSDGGDFLKSVGTVFQRQLDQLSAENTVLFDQMISYTPTAADVGKTLNIVFRADRPFGTSVYPSEVWFDGVSMQMQAVPEPATVVPAGIALLVVTAAKLGRRRRGR